MKILNKKLFYILGVIIIIGIGIYVVYKTVNRQPYTSSLIITQTSTLNNDTETKIYRNTEFGFEFEYPKDWTLHKNTFGGPNSKFNLIGASPKEKGIPNPIIPSFLVNIVTPEFGERAFSDLVGINVKVAGISGKRYEYEFEGFSKIAIDLPFEEYHVFLVAIKQHESVFNQILASFKFIK